MEQKKVANIISENNELLQKLPESLAKHIEIYENIHKDLNYNSDYLSMSHYRNTEESSESYINQFVEISSDFVNTLSRLKANFTTLAAQLASKDSNSQTTQPQHPYNNFELFVSSHCQAAADIKMDIVCEPFIKGKKFQVIEF